MGSRRNHRSSNRMVGCACLGNHRMERRSAMSAGKGDAPRPVNAEVYGQNYNDIFRKPKRPNLNTAVEFKLDGFSFTGSVTDRDTLDGGFIIVYRDRAGDRSYVGSTNKNIEIIKIH